MPVLINWKICDNSEECDGIEVCPTGAFYWDEKKKSIAIDEKKCINCGKCDNVCPVGAIRFAKNETERKKFQKEIDEDPKKVSDLFIDRYGASPVQSSSKLITPGRFNVQIIKSTRLAAIEIFDDDSIECLANSIPVRELFFGSNIRYRKMKVDDNAFLKKYKVKKLPVLLFFKNGKLLGKIEGYFGIGKKRVMLKEINKIIKSK